MPIKQILRPKACYAAAGCGHTKFGQDYVHHDDEDPYVPHTDNKVRRLRPIRLGVRNIGFYAHELDELLTGLGNLRNKPKRLV